jgi:hypothetical protein
VRFRPASGVKGRALFWAAVIAAGAFRPGLDTIERWLSRPCWSVPSCWNAVAEVAVRVGAIDPLVEGRPAPWRQASVFSVPRTLGVVTVSDMVRSRSAFMDEDYHTLGLLERSVAEPLLVTDMARGFKPLSHLWPVYDSNRDGRLETLVAFAPTLSEELVSGTYAYLSLGEENEVLFACRLLSAPGPRFARLERGDVNGDGFEDLVVRATEPPGTAYAVFEWRPDERGFLPREEAEAASFLSFWCSSDGDRMTFGRHESLDERVRPILARLAGDASALRH